MKLTEMEAQMILRHSPFYGRTLTGESKEAVKLAARVFLVKRAQLCDTDYHTQCQRQSCGG